jgi:Ca-activated chloride channel family protein
MDPRRSFLRLALGLALLSAMALPALSQDQGRIRFVAPRNMATALGSTEIDLTVVAPEGLTVVNVVLTVDGQPLTTLTERPWMTTWDAGDGSKGHRLKAVARLSDGSTLETAINTSPLRINYVEQVDLVNLYVLVRTRGGQYVTDLEKGDFAVEENGRTQRIQRFSTEGKPLRIGIVIDTSLSMQGKRLESAQRAALDFLGALQPDDTGMVVTFNDDVYVPETLTNDRAQLASVIRGAEARGGTALYDAIWRTSHRLRKFDGRRVLVLLSDGKDESYDGLEPGSLHTLEEALNQALRNEVMVFAIGLGRDLKSLDFYQRNTLESILTRLADETGGRVVFLKSPGQLKKAFQEVALDLRHQYSLAYSSDDPARDGKWRRIRLQVPSRDVEVITRKGYYAPKDDDGKNTLGSR